MPGALAAGRRTSRVGYFWVNSHKASSQDGRCARDAEKNTRISRRVRELQCFQDRVRIASSIRARRRDLLIIFKTRAWIWRNENRRLSLPLHRATMISMFQFFSFDLRRETRQFRNFFREKNFFFKFRQSDTRLCQPGPRRARKRENYFFSFGPLREIRQFLENFRNAELTLKPQQHCKGAAAHFAAARFAAKNGKFWKC